MSERESTVEEWLVQLGANPHTARERVEKNRAQAVAAYLASPEAAAALAEALKEHRHDIYWLVESPSTHRPTQENRWQKVARAILAAWRKGLTP